MKKSSILFLIIILIPIMVAMLYFKPNNQSINTSSKKESNLDSRVDTISADTNLSELLWTGFKLTGKHNGNLKLANGSFYIKNNIVVGGEFVFNMNSINCTDLQGKKKESIENHLKDEDFFEVEKHPNSSFTITNIEAQNDSLGKFNISGNLTIKDSTLNIQFPANILISDSIIQATSSPFNIDRTKWGIMYSSKKVLDNWKEGYIYDNMEIIINVVGKK